MPGYSRDQLPIMKPQVRTYPRRPHRHLILLTRIIKPLIPSVKQILLLLCLCPVLSSATPAPPVSPTDADHTESPYTPSANNTTESPLSASSGSPLPSSEATTSCDDVLEEDCWFAESSADYAPIPWNTEENKTLVIPAQVSGSPSKSTTPPAVMIGIAQKAVDRGYSSKDHTSHIATGVTVAGIAILIVLVIVAFRTKAREPRPVRAIYLGVPPPDVELTV
ncbi:ORF25 [Fowl aviadenovirus E]|uniref:ORF25 n=1 Tax=Fowl aviadenovirus E TaxID=190065 RepID=A0A650BZR3_9ADEN|nr:ORF25 [Fowl aviadenovirus E]